VISYGADFIDQYRRAAGYVARILKGEKPSELPVQAPSKYELVDLRPRRRLASPCRKRCSLVPTRSSSDLRPLYWLVVLFLPSAVAWR